LNVAYKYIKPIIEEKAGFDIDEVDLENLVQLINSPGIFIASKQDCLIPFSQIDDIFNKYRGEKEMFFIEESHNEARNMGVIKKVFKTLKKYLLLSEQS
jgi:esterase/lipase